MEEYKEYRIVSFKRKNKEGYLEGIEYAKRKMRKDERSILISKWNGWDKSFWIKIKGHSSQVILDSGVIEQLAEEIKRIKKRGLKKDVFDKLFLINNPKDIY